MDDIRIWTLGRFIVEVGKHVIQHGGGRRDQLSAFRLLKTLITQPNRRLAVDQVLTFVWPDTSPLRRSLDRAVAQLNRELLSGSSDQSRTVVSIADDMVSVHPEAPVWVDADAFGDLIAQARHSADPGHQLREADALYQGEYLPDDVDAVWAFVRREELRQAWVELQLLIAGRAEQQGNVEIAANALRRVLAQHVGHEQASRDLARLEHRSGRPYGAHAAEVVPTGADLDSTRQPASRSVETEHAPSADRFPTSMATFLLTDVEGSTALWEEASESMHTALASHDRLFEDIVRAHHGEHIRPRGEGDSRFAVFAWAPDAVAAAVEIQRAFVALSWPTPRPIRVRMSLHTGDARLREGDYYGSVVNRCARVRDLGHGGQILLTRTTYDLVHDSLSSDVELIDIGEYLLKDFSSPDQIFQIVATGLPRKFPRLRGSDSAPPTVPLPARHSRLIGREQEMAACIDLLLNPDVRLLTLTGPPGTGKTRLGLELARDLSDRFVNGACFVALAPISDTELVIPAIGHALGLLEGGSRPLIEILKSHLRDKELLLLLDNFEHVLPVAVRMAELLETSPRLKVLVTSRAPLHLRAEREFPVPPLALPDRGMLTSVDNLAQSAAVTLFAERATAVKPDFVLTEENAATICEICYRLDGLPLAIELAAARVKLLPPRALLARLERPLPLLVGGARDLPARQQTLRGAIAWSHDLLDDGEQRLFRRLSVLVGGWTVPAAAVICEDLTDLHLSTLDGVSSLFDKSLIEQDVSADLEPRFRMLETIREYGLDQLDLRGEGPEMCDRHLDYYVGLAEEADAGLLGPDQVVWCERLEAEHDNLRAAFAWVLRALSTEVPETSGLARAPSRLEAGIRLADGLEQFWMLRGHVRENWPRVMDLVARAPAQTPARAAILVVAACAANCLQEMDAAVRLADEAATIWRALGDARGLASALARRGIIATLQGDHARAEGWLTESRALFRDNGGERRSGIEHPVASFLAQAVQDLGDPLRAYDLYEEAVAEAHARGDRHAAAYALRHMGRQHLAHAETHRAIECIVAGLPALLDLQDRRCTPPSLEILACCIGPDGGAADAVRLLAAANAIRHSTGMPLGQADHARQEGERASLAIQLGDERFAGAWVEGRAMSMNEAIVYAREAALAHTASRART